MMAGKVDFMGFRNSNADEDPFSDSMSVQSCTDVHIILASASPRRKDLLGRLGIRFEIIPSNIDEEALDGESPEEHVRRLAGDKALEVAATVPHLWILGADTIVVIDGKILGKPTDRNEAALMLGMLSDRVHTVYTGYALVNARLPDKVRVNHVCSGVHIRQLSQDEIEAYIDTGEPMDKAGAYAVQGIGSAIVADISGSYTNVVGLPLCEVASDLKELAIFDFLKGRGKS
jgi:septum formation protein